MIGRGIILVAGLLLGAPALAACDLKEAGFHEPKNFHKFFAELKAAAAAKDQKAISKMASYPLRLGKKDRIKNETELKKRFGKVFTPKVLEAIAHHQESDLRCTYEGAVIGEGQVWIQEIEGVVAISAVNLPPEK